MQFIQENLQIVTLLITVDTSISKTPSFHIPPSGLQPYCYTNTQHTSVLVLCNTATHNSTLYNAEIDKSSITLQCTYCTILSRTPADMNIALRETLIYVITSLKHLDEAFAHTNHHPVASKQSSNVAWLFSYKHVLYIYCPRWQRTFLSSHHKMN